MLKKLLAVTLLAFTMILGGCQLSTEDLAEEVRANIEETLKADGSTRHVKVTDFSLVHEDGKRYRGILNTREHGQKFVYSVRVTYDGERFMWEIEE